MKMMVLHTTGKSEKTIRFNEPSTLMVGWTAASVPYMYDYPYLYDIQEGDEIQIKIGGDTQVYKVLSVRPAAMKDYPPEMNLVTLEGG